MRKLTRRKMRSRRHRRSRNRRQRKQMKMKGGVDTPLFGDDESTIMPIENENSNILDDTDITPPFTDDTDYGHTTQESVSNSDLSLDFGGKKRMRRMSKTQRKRRSLSKTRTKRRSLQRAGGFTITEDTSPEAYDDDYETNLANIEEVMLNS